MIKSIMRKIDQKDQYFLSLHLIAKSYSDFDEAGDMNATNDRGMTTIGLLGVAEILLKTHLLGLKAVLTSTILNLRGLRAWALAE